VIKEANVAIDLSNVERLGDIQNVAINDLRDELQAVIDGGLGYSKFCVALNRDTGECELLGIRHGQLVWFRMDCGSTASIQKFTEGVWYRCSLEPNLPDWGEKLTRKYPKRKNPG
jgi:hypothetical protein